MQNMYKNLLLINKGIINQSRFTKVGVKMMEIQETLLKKKASNKGEDFNLYLHTIVHELKNPLVSIQGFTSLLFEEYGKVLPKDGKRYLERIFFNLTKVESVLLDLSKFARVSIDESDFEMISANEIIEVAKEPVILQLKKKQITLVIQSELPDLYCDANAMIQVFSNLISNAIKYSHDHRPGNIEIGYIADEIFHKLFIKDNGVGIRSKDRNKVFLLFSRLDNKEGVSGSGLGLTIVKRIIEGHGGEIWVDSRLNKGATFYFTLPKENSILSHHNIYSNCSKG